MAMCNELKNLKDYLRKNGFVSEISGDILEIENLHYSGWISFNKYAKEDKYEVIFKDNQGVVAKQFRKPKVVLAFLKKRWNRSTMVGTQSKFVMVDEEFVKKNEE